MPDLHHFVEIEAPSDKVYAALTTSEGLQGWWTLDASARPEAGTIAEFGFNQRQVVFRMKIEELEPNRTVRWSCLGDHPEWEGTRLAWRLNENNGSTTLSLLHSDWKELTPFLASCNSMWGHLMYRLKEFVEEGRPNARWSR